MEGPPAPQLADRVPHDHLDAKLRLRSKNSPILCASTAWEKEATVDDPKVADRTLGGAEALAPFDAILSLNCASEEADAMIRSASRRQH